MLKLLLSRSTLKRLKNVQNFNRKIFEVIRNIPWGISILVIITILTMIFVDFCLCSYFDEKSENNTSVNIEEIVVSHESEIVNMASAYLSNYEALTSNAKDYLKLEFGEISVTFDKNSDEKVIVSAEASNYNSIEFILKGDILEKLEDNTKVESIDNYLLEKIVYCIFIDIIILFIGFLIYLLGYSIFLLFTT